LLSIAGEDHTEQVKPLMVQKNIIEKKRMKILDQQYEEDQKRKKEAGDAYA